MEYSYYADDQIDGLILRRKIENCRIMHYKEGRK